MTKNSQVAPSGAGGARQQNPAKSDMAKKIELIAAEFENGDRYVLPIALKLERWRNMAWLTVVRPVFDEFELEHLLTGWKGPRGKLYYLDDEVDVLIYLTEEGGRRDARISRCKLTAELCRRIEETARKAWREGALPRHVEKSLEALNLLNAANRL